MSWSLIVSNLAKTGHSNYCILLAFNHVLLVCRKNIAEWGLLRFDTGRKLVYSISVVRVQCFPRNKWSRTLFGNIAHNQ